MLSLTKKAVCIALCFFTVLPSLSYAEDNLVTNLKKGQNAPFDGILLSETSAAKLFADIKFSKKECDALVLKERDILGIKHTAEIDNLKLILEIEKNRTKALLEVRNERIAFLEKNYLPPAWYESGEFWFAIGTLAGIGITVAAGYALGQAR